MARKRRKKRSKKKNTKPFVELEKEVISSVVGVILLALAVVVALAHFGVTTGVVSMWLANILTLLFGAAAFLFPLILAIISLYILLSHKPRVIGSTVLGGVMLFVSTLGIIEVLNANSNFLGGWVGYAFAWPFVQSVGFWGSLVIFAALLLSGILITFRIPLKSYARDVLLPGEDGEEHLGTLVERGLVTTLSDAARKMMPQKKMPPADKTVTVNQPTGTAATDEHKQKQTTKSAKNEKGGLRIIPASKNYSFPPVDLLEEESGSPEGGDIKAHALVIQRTLENFGIPVEMAEVNVGPSVTQFTLKPATGIKLSKLTVLQNDLALALAAHPIRIEAPIPGKSLVGIEIPNTKSMIVRLRNMFDAYDPSSGEAVLNIALGRAVSGEPYWTSLAGMPHLLVAGATGTGKSVAINAMLLSFLFQHSPETLRLILIDPKRVELSLYNGIPHLLTPVISEPKKSVAALKWAVSEMERRYEELEEEGARDIASYNQKMRGRKNTDFMPYIVVVIDELADLMAAHGRDIEGAIVRLAQMARAVGIHLVVSTQRPSVEVITGLIKANITSRVAFQVASQIDSRTILDSAGAEKLLGKGDMLFSSPQFTRPRRLQGTFVSEKEVSEVVSFLKKQKSTVAQDDETEESEGIEEALTGPEKKGIDLDSFSAADEPEDELYEDAKQLVIQADKASSSMIQRHLRVGYARAARLLDMLEERGVVGPQDGSKPREVYAGAADTHASETAPEEKPPEE